MQRFLYCVLRKELIIGWLLLAISGQSIAAERTILVMGDSISAAYGMSLEQGWVALMAAEVTDSDSNLTVVNASISGETTAGALRRLPALLQQHNPALVLIELGANDGLRGYPLSTLRNNLAQLVALSQQSGASVILLPMEIPPNYGTRYTSGFRESYRQVAADTSSVLTPFILNGVATNTQMMQADGIHPTAAAQPMLLANVLPTITEFLDAL